MPQPVILLTRSNIEKSDFIDFLISETAILHPDIVYDARISQGNNHVWIVMESKEHLDIFEEELKDQGRQNIYNLIIEKLCSTPMTSIILDISNTPGSSRLAIAFACNFAQHWPCVLYDLKDRVYSLEDLLVLHQKNQELPKY